MQKYLRTERLSAPVAPGLDPTYRPAVDAYAQRLIARIQYDHEDTSAVLELEAHYEAHGDYPSLANLLEGWAPTLHDDQAAADAYVKAADAVLLGLNDHARGQMLLQRALERSAACEPAFERLEKLLREQGDDTGLERCLSQAVSELALRDADPKLRAGIHLRLGQLYEERLLLRGRAIAEYRSAVELDPMLVPAIAAARGIYVNSGKVEAAADMFELQIAGTSEPAARHALLVGLAKHRRHVLGDLDGAIHVLRRALKALPAEPPTYELLAEMLSVRSKRKDNEHRAADVERAAEFYYQVARTIARGLAQPRLEACLALQPEHARARRMLDELTRYGASEQPLPGQSGITQAELEGRTTGRYPLAEQLSPGHTLPGLGAIDSADVAPIEGERAPEQFDQGVAAWLDESDVASSENSVSSQRMVPLSDRPPALATPPASVRAKSRWPN